MKNFDLKEHSQEHKSDAKEHGQREPGKYTVEVLGMCLSRVKRTGCVIHLANTCVMCLNAFTWRKIWTIGDLTAFYSSVGKESDTGDEAGKGETRKDNTGIQKGKKHS